MNRTPSILVVDDDADCIEFAKAVLKPRYEVRTASSVEKCREALLQRPPDLILLDVMMTHLCDGLDFSRELKESAATRDIPVIMLTNVNQVYDYRSQIESSYFPHDCWLDKPTKPDVLLAAVQNQLARVGIRAEDARPTGQA
jgi:putative two-component system response regulator